MAAKVKWVRFRSNKAGALVRGSDPVLLDHFDRDMHMDRAVWLTSALEAPKWGTVQSYDGAAMSGGLLHNIAVAPRTMKQSSFFPLLRRIEITAGKCPPLRAVWAALAEEGYYVARDGKLRDKSIGAAISGRRVRALFTPPNGNVPRQGEHWQQARRWALLFHELLAHPKARRGQIQYAAEWMASSRTELEMQGYGAQYLDSPIGIRSETLDPHLDLGMAVYHSFSVNGPSPAAKALAWALKRETPESDPPAFAALLVRKLGTSSFGVWKERRYPHTRKAVLRGVKAGLWTKAVADTVIPYRK